MGSMATSVLANEFDILGEPVPTKNYFIDDAGVLSKSTRSDLNKRLSILEVRRQWLLSLCFKNYHGLHTVA